MEFVSPTPVETGREHAIARLGGSRHDPGRIQPEDIAGFVAKHVVPGGIPIPESSVEAFTVSKPDSFGGRFQGMYESGWPEEEILRFYRSWLHRKGWRVNPGVSEEISRRSPGRSLAFRREGLQLLVSVFPQDHAAGSDFRISVITRPGGLSR